MLRDRDYLLRMAQELASFLSKLMLRRNELGEIRSSLELDDLAQRFVGLGMETLELLPAGQLVTMLGLGGSPDVGRLYAAGRLLETRALLAEEVGAGVLAERLSRKALYLLGKPVEYLGGYLNEEHEDAVRRLEAKLDAGDAGDD